MKKIVILLTVALFTTIAYTSSNSYKLYPNKSKIPGSYVTWKDLDAWGPHEWSQLWHDTFHWWMAASRLEGYEVFHNDENVRTISLHYGGGLVCWDDSKTGCTRHEQVIVDWDTCYWNIFGDETYGCRTYIKKSLIELDIDKASSMPWHERTRIAFHEFGHAFGLTHVNGATNNPNADQFDIMWTGDTPYFDKFFREYVSPKNAQGIPTEIPDRCHPLLFDFLRRNLPNDPMIANYTCPTPGALEGINQLY